MSQSQKFIITTLSKVPGQFSVLCFREAIEAVEVLEAVEALELLEAKKCLNTVCLNIIHRRKNASTGVGNELCFTKKPSWTVFFDDVAAI